MRDIREKAVITRIKTMITSIVLEIDTTSWMTG